MLDAAVRALVEIFSKPMRAILWKSVGLALILIVVGAIALQRVLNWLAGAGAAWAEQAAHGGYHSLFETAAWIVSIAAGLGVVFGAIFLMPAVTSIVASMFVDDVGEHVERKDYPAEQVGKAVPLMRALIESIKIAALTIVVYLAVLPFVFFAGMGFIAFFLATAWLLGRQYFEFAAMRFRSVEDAKAMRHRHAMTIFIAGLFIAAFVSIPIVNLATPVFGMAFMVHMHKRLSGRRPELMEPERKAHMPAA